MYLNIFIIFFMTGFLTKLADEYDNKKLLRYKILLFIAGPLYGLFIGMVILIQPLVAPLWLGAVFGNIIAGKIDSLSHYAAMAALIITLLFSGTLSLNVLLIVIFTLVCVLEEFIHYLAVDKKKVKNKTFRNFIELRPLLEVVAFIYSWIIGEWVVWLSLLLFDIGYYLSSKLIRKKETS